MKVISNLLKILDSPKELSFEQRVFIKISFVSALLLFTLIPINYFENMAKAHILILWIGGVLTLSTFLLARYKNIQLIPVYILFAVIMLAILWYTNGGSYGSMQYYFIITIACSMIFLRGRKRNIFFIINIIVVGYLILFEYYNPQNIIYYDSIEDRYMDLITGIMICFFILGIIFKILMDNFDKERGKVEQKAIELENRNQSLLTKNREIKENQNQLLEVLTELKNSEKKFRSFFQMANDIIYIMDKYGMILELNRSAQEILGYDEKEMCYKSLGKFLTPDSKEYFHKNLPILIKNGSKRSQLKFRSKKNEIITVDCSTSVIYDDRGDVQYIVAFQRDITELKKNEERIQHLAYHDMITDLPNRRFGKEILQSAIENAGDKCCRMGVLFIDLDRFKYVNDTLGHDAGDFLLKNVAKRLKNCIRERDAVVRLGGDEFMIILDRICSEMEVTNITDRIIYALSKPFMLNTHEIHITCSIGISMFPEHGNDIKTLLKNADIAMYEAKENGRNNYKFFSHRLDDKMNNDMEIREGIIKAIENREFILHYQPIIDIKTDEIVGCEALVRWNHPQRGLIYPGDFIPVAEQCGLIKNIDKMVFKMACSQIKTWFNKGIDPMGVAINISANPFKDCDFIDILDCIILETGVNPALLNLEITERTAMEDTDYTQRVFSEIKKRGIKLSLDDFGTGYSSLNYLRSFPIDVLKIDKSFVDEVCFNKVNHGIIQAAITMAKVLGIKVVAEGVETKEQLELLRESDCEECQGYLYSKPVPPEEMERMFMGKFNVDKIRVVS